MILMINKIRLIQVVILMVLQAVILLMYDVKVPVESKICQTLKKIEMPDLSHVGISISNKSKAKKEATLANSWNCLTVDCGFNSSWRNMPHKRKICCARERTFF